MAQLEKQLDIADLPPFLTVAEAASLIRVELGTCYRMIGRGDLPVARFGTTIRIPSRLLLAQIEAAQVAI